MLIMKVLLTLFAHISTNYHRTVPFKLSKAKFTPKAASVPPPTQLSVQQSSDDDSTMPVDSTEHQLPLNNMDINKISSAESNDSTSDSSDCDMSDEEKKVVGKKAKKATKKAKRAAKKVRKAAKKKAGHIDIEAMHETKDGAIKHNEFDAKCLNGTPSKQVKTTIANTDHGLDPDWAKTISLTLTAPP
ncbi:hypothetical protein APHAL10511_000629 [Amanita phalloides]|nr:hypothetical protein APHAL10511_000629 [Amanita phalloides]